jgi:hypothetical protein
MVLVGRAADERAADAADDGSRAGVAAADAGDARAAEGAEEATGDDTLAVRIIAVGLLLGVLLALPLRGRLCRAACREQGAGSWISRPTAGRPRGSNWDAIPVPPYLYET